VSGPSRGCLQKSIPGGDNFSRVHQGCKLNLNNKREKEGTEEKGLNQGSND